MWAALKFPASRVSRLALEPEGMKYLSGFLGFVILLLALVFALSNRQPATLAFWPFGYDLAAPLCFFLLAAFLGGSLLGAAFSFCAMLPVYWESRRLRRDMARQRQRVAELEEEVARREAANANRDDGDKPRFLPGLSGRSAASGFLRNHFFSSWGPR